jgi:hypothetical protein
MHDALNAMPDMMVVMMMRAALELKTLFYLNCFANSV